MLTTRLGRGVSALLIVAAAALGAGIAATASAQTTAATAEQGVCSHVHCMGTVQHKSHLCTVGCVGASGSGQLAFNGGTVETAPAGIYLVFWGSQWNNNDPSGEAATLQNFFNGTGGSSWNNTVTQYCQGVPAGTMYCNGSGMPVGNNTGMLRGVWYDNAGPAPSSPTQSDLAAEAVRAAAHWGNTTATANLDVQYAIETATGNSSSGFGTQYCAWHSSTSSSSGNIAYTNAPYITDAGGSCGANFNGLGANAGITIVGGHEYAETETDPFPNTGWLDSSNAEIGDKCAWISSGQGAAANVSFSTGTFPVQSLWSNAFANDAGGCVLTYLPSVYQLHSNGEIWAYTGTPCSSGSCPGWMKLDKNPAAVAIAAGGSSLYQLHSDGSIYMYTGTPCSPSGSCPGWQELDNNPATKKIVAAGLTLYQLHSDGSIFQYTGTPCGSSCPGWQQLDNNPATTSLAATGSNVYQLHSGGGIWVCTGTPCSGSSCPGWQQLDNNAGTTAIAAGGSNLYQQRSDGSIWTYLGVACNASLCPGWQELDNNPSTKAIAAGSSALYQIHTNGAIFTYTGTPCTPLGCSGWQELDNNPAGTAIAASTSNLYQLHSTGAIWIYTGTPCSSAGCFGWQELDNNSATVAIVAPK